MYCLVASLSLVGSVYESGDLIIAFSHCVLIYFILQVEVTPGGDCWITVGCVNSVQIWWDIDIGYICPVYFKF